MVMGQTDIEEQAPVILDVCMEFYLKERADPLSIFTTYALAAALFNEVDDKTEFLSSIVVGNLLEILDSRTEGRFVLTDKDDHAYVIVVTEVQAFSVSVPEEESIDQALAEVEQS